jgi:hypothetical protein
MKVIIKGTKIIVSEAPKQDVPGAFLLLYKDQEKEIISEIIVRGKKRTKVKEIVKDVTIDAKNGQKEYDLPNGIEKKDVEALYLRVL